MPVTDDDLFRAMFSEDKAIARAAKELYDRLHWRRSAAALASGAGALRRVLRGVSEMPELTPREVVERIEGMFEAQLEGSDLYAALESLQEDLIGADPLAELRAARFKVYQDAHPWLYPEIYGPVSRPPRSQILTPDRLARLALEALQESLKASNQPPRGGEEIREWK